jgi:ATP-binding cassette subfamily C protein LapB
VDRLLLFDKGRLVADGPRDAVLARLRGATGAPPVTPAPAPAAAAAKPRGKADAAL